MSPDDERCQRQAAPAWGGAWAVVIRSRVWGSWGCGGTADRGEGRAGELEGDSRGGKHTIQSSISGSDHKRRALGQVDQGEGSGWGSCSACGRCRGYSGGWVQPSCRCLATCWRCWHMSSLSQNVRSRRVDWPTVHTRSKEPTLPGITQGTHARIQLPNNSASGAASYGSFGSKWSFTIAFP